MTAPRAAAAVDVRHDPDALTEPLRSAVLWLMANGNVGLESGRRTTAQQLDLRRSHGCGNGREYDRACKGTPTTAIPGTSKHETGEAADLNGDLGFVAAHAAQLGIVATVPGEAWHYEWKGPNRPPTAPGAPLLGSIFPNGAGTTALGATGGLGGARDAFATLTDPHTWFRVLLVLGGAALIIAGAGQLTGGTKVAATAAFPELAAAAQLAGGAK